MSIVWFAEITGLVDGEDGRVPGSPVVDRRGAEV
jgi:hypothetical protein